MLDALVADSDPNSLALNNAGGYRPHTSRPLGGRCGPGRARRARAAWAESSASGRAMGSSNPVDMLVAARLTAVRGPIRSTT
jgi:hypothetical protein